jgi:hypothetical protein
MRKSILALIPSLLAITLAFISPLPIDEVAKVSVSNAILSAQATPSAIPTSSFETQSAETPVRGRPPLSLTLILLGLCCFFLLFIGILILGFVVRRQSIKEWKNDQQSKSS